jgi:hypothetical protein
VANSYDRKVITNLFEGVEITDALKEAINKTDRMVDESLDHLLMEEPTFDAWVRSDPDIATMFKTTLTAIKWTLHKSNDPNVAFENVSALIARLLHTATWKAAIRERGIDLSEIVPKSGKIKGMRKKKVKVKKNGF